MVRFFEKKLVFVEKTLNIFGVSMILVMMCIITGDVLGRKLFNKPIQGTYEVGQLLMIFLVFLGLAYTQAARGHVRVGIIIERLPSKQRIIFDLFASVCMLILAGLITWGGLTEAIHSWQVGESSFGIISFPLYPSRTIVPVGGLLLFLRALLDIMLGIRNLSAINKDLSEGKPAGAGAKATEFE